MSGKGKIIRPCNSDEQTITVYHVKQLWQSVCLE